MLIAFGFLFLFGLGTVSAVGMDFNLTLHCRYRGNRCFMIRYYEIDLIEDDVLSASEECMYERESRTVKFYNRAWQSNDGEFDNEFELLLTILHNCNAEGYSKYANYTLPTVSMKKFFTIELDIDITDQAGALEPVASTVYTHGKFGFDRDVKKDYETFLRHLPQFETLGETWKRVAEPKVLPIWDEVTAFFTGSKTIRPKPKPTPKPTRKRYHYKPKQ